MVKHYILISIELVKEVKSFLSELTPEQIKKFNIYLHPQPQFAHMDQQPHEYLDQYLNKLLLSASDFVQSDPVLVKCPITKSELVNFIAVEETISFVFDGKLFDILGAKFGQAKGREKVDFINYGSTKVALKHYYRGGLLSKINREKYLWLGLKATRQYKEIQVNQYLQKNSFPTSHILAVKIFKDGFLYTGDLITSYLENAKTLVELLDDEHLSQADWGEIGRIMAQMHNLGVNHPDLNANNLIRSNGSWHIIDFDKAEILDIKAEGKLFANKNIQRLLRSLNKEMKNKQILFDIYQWEFFLDAYYKHLNQQ